MHTRSAIQKHATCLNVRERMRRITKNGQNSTTQRNGARNRTLRLETVHEFGEIAYTMRPVANVVRTLKSQLEGVLPEVSMELSSVNETLEGLAVEVG